jgi:hypothetical protein
MDDRSDVIVAQTRKALSERLAARRRQEKAVVDAARRRLAKKESKS